jgi:Flp pilus assembly protein TadG
VLVVLLCFVVALGRFALVRAHVDGAARDAARAASLEPNPADARARADAIAQQTLSGDKMTCQDRRVTVDTTRAAPGGFVAVDVSCTINLRDVSLLGLPGSRRVQGHFVAPIDRYGSQ